jgi:hypothetical protein
MRLPLPSEFGRSMIRLASTLIVLTTLSCADSTAPGAGDAAASLSRGSGSSGSSQDSLWGGSDVPTSETPGTVRLVGQGLYEFTVTDQGGLFFIGPHLISFSDRAICDPERSSYGPTEWDKPCPAIDHPITIRAQVTNVRGHPRIDFTPELRFVPKQYHSQGVWLYLQDRSLSGDNSGSGNASNRFEIFWAPSQSAPLVDEERVDDEVRTEVEMDTQVLFRKIKHFSGYTVDLCRDAEYE